MIPYLRKHPNLAFSKMSYLMGFPHLFPKNLRSQRFRSLTVVFRQYPDTPWCWNIYLRIYPKNHAVLSVNLPAPWSVSPIFSPRCPLITGVDGVNPWFGESNSSTVVVTQLTVGFFGYEFSQGRWSINPLIICFINSHYWVPKSSCSDTPISWPSGKLIE